MNDQLIAKFINTDANTMKGWFFPPDMLTFYVLNTLQTRFNVQGSLCEVGVYEGKSLVLLSLFAKDSEAVYGFDLFPDDMQANCQANINRLGNPAVVKLFAGDTSTINTQGLKDIVQQPTRMLHIDAGHEYHEVLHQLHLFAPFVKEGGIIIMDDYQDREFPGIEAAVLDFCEIDRPRRFVPFFAGGNKMFLCERQNAATYQRGMLDFEHYKDKTRLSRVKDFDILVGFSKLPVPNEAVLKQIAEHEFPLTYHWHEQQAAKEAAAFDQLTFGSGKQRN